MPGLARLQDDDHYLRAFRAIDSVIQDKQPIFVLNWVGSVMGILVTAVFGWKELEDGPERNGLLVATFAYLLAHAITVKFNVPFIVRIQALAINKLDASQKKAERYHFHLGWCFWNLVRTAIMGSVALYLHIFLLTIETPSGK